MSLSFQLVYMSRSAKPHKKSSALRQSPAHVWWPHGPEYLHHLPATFLLISSRHGAAEGFDHVMGKHITALELLTSCLTLVTEPGYYAAVQRSGA